MMSMTRFDWVRLEATRLGFKRLGSSPLRAVRLCSLVLAGAISWTSAGAPPVDAPGSGGSSHGSAGTARHADASESTRNRSPLALAGDALERGDRHAALAMLAKALQHETIRVADILPAPRLLPLHEAPEFRALMREHAGESEIVIAPDGEPGEPIIVEGRVVDAQGLAVPDALVHVFQTNDEGVYSSKGGNATVASLTPRLFGYLRTDAEGMYRYRTVRPGEYLGGGPPRHIHYEVETPDRAKLVTEIMFADDARIAKEPGRWHRPPSILVARRVEGQRQSGSGGADEPEVARYRADIVLP